MKKVKISVGVIIKDGKYLCMKRGDYKYDYLAHKYEFPGGKIEENETALACLCRELHEELGIHIEAEKVRLMMTTQHTYPDFMVHMSVFTYPYQGEKIQLNVHEEMQWVSGTNLKFLDWIEGDTEIIDYLSKMSES